VFQLAIAGRTERALVRAQIRRSIGTQSDVTAAALESELHGVLSPWASLTIRPSPNSVGLSLEPGSGDASPERIARQDQNVAVTPPEMGSGHEASVDEAEFLEGRRMKFAVPRPIGPEEEVEVPVRPALRVNAGGVGFREHLGTSQFDALEPELLADDPFRAGPGGLELDQVTGGQQPTVLQRFEVGRFEAPDLRPGRGSGGATEHDQVRVLGVPDEDEHGKTKPGAGGRPHPAARDLALGGAVPGEPAGGRRVHGRGDAPRSYGLCFRSGAAEKAPASPEIWASGIGTPTRMPLSLGACSGRSVPSRQWATSFTRSSKTNSNAIRPGPGVPFAAKNGSRGASRNEVTMGRTPSTVAGYTDRTRSELAIASAWRGSPSPRREMISCAIGGSRTKSESRAIEAADSSGRTMVKSAMLATAS